MKRRNKFNTLKKFMVRKIFVFMAIIYFIFFLSCNQSSKLPKEIVPDYTNKEGILLEVKPTTKELKDNSEVILNLKIINKLSNTSDVFINIIAPNFLKFKNSIKKEIALNKSIQYTVRGMSEIDPGGGILNDIYYFSLENVRYDKKFSIIFNYFFEKEVENTLVYCLDFHSFGYTPIKGCSAKVEIPLPQGNPLYISNVVYDIKKLDSQDDRDRFLITFTVYLEKNKNFFFYANCKEINYASYGKINISMIYPNADELDSKEKSKIIDIYKSDSVSFSYLIRRQKKEVINSEDYVIIKYKYCAENNYPINDFIVNIEEK